MRTVMRGAGRGLVAIGRASGPGQPRERTRPDYCWPDYYYYYYYLLLLTTTYYYLLLPTTTGQTTTTTTATTITTTAAAATKPNPKPKPNPNPNPNPNLKPNPSTIQVGPGLLRTRPSPHRYSAWRPATSDTMLPSYHPCYSAWPP
eukprot:scaffold17395_cov39-Phaeocystis_antarctica.AAC.1